jgi:hypothetical protein
MASLLQIKEEISMPLPPQSSLTPLLLPSDVTVKTKLEFVLGLLAPSQRYSTIEEEEVCQL